MDGSYLMPDTQFHLLSGTSFPPIHNSESIVILIVNKGVLL